MKTTFPKKFHFILIFAFAISCGCIQTNFKTKENEITSEGIVEFNNKLDVLFVVDSSASMLQYRQKLAEQISAFSNRLNETKMDYHIAVTSMDMEKLNQTCLSSSRQLIGDPSFLTKDNINQLKTRLIGDSISCPTTKGLDAMAHVISKNFLDLTKSEFLRHDAFFSVIFISDEDDRSTEYGPSGVNDFINLLEKRKALVPGYRRGWNANFIGYVNEFSTCDFLGVKPTVGKRYMQLVKFSEGLALPICNSNFYEILNGISKKLIQTSRTIKFSSSPDENSIRVYINDIFIPRSSENGWDLKIVNEQNNSASVYLIFNGPSTPSSTQTVKVFYDPKQGT